jgi:putative endonuclease
MMPRYGAEHYDKMPIEKQVHYVYILQCKGGKRYCGMTSNVINRLTQHISGRGAARFTKGFPPIDLLHVEMVSTYGEAARREIQLKRMMRERVIIQYNIIPKYRIIFTVIKKMLEQYSGDSDYVKRELNAIERGGYDEPGTE